MAILMGVKWHLGGGSGFHSERQGRMMGTPRHEDGGEGPRRGRWETQPRGLRGVVVSYFD